MNQNQFDDRTQNQKQKQFDGHIFWLLELIKHMEQVRDGEYKETCNIFMELRKLFKETKQEIIHTTVYQTMIRRRIRSRNKHMKSKKCCMTHEAKFQTHKRYEIYKMELGKICNFGNMEIGKIPKDQLKILLPNYEELFNECITEQEQKAFKHKQLYTFH